MARAYLYLALAGLAWLIEGFLFSHYLNFSWWQSGILGVLYLSLFALATQRLLDALRAPPDTSAHVAAWRVVTLAPMLVVILGSFASLPLIVVVAALGKL
jgi:hypothetical protein